MWVAWKLGGEGRAHPSQGGALIKHIGRYEVGAGTTPAANRQMRDIGLLALAAEQTAQHAAQDLPADAAGDRAGGRFGRRLDGALTPLGAP